MAKLKPGGAILIVGFAAAIVGFGFYASQHRGNVNVQPVTNGNGGGDTTPTGGGSGGGETAGGDTGGEAPLTGTIQDTFKEVGREQLAITGKKGDYAWDAAKPTVVFQLNVWAGWGPVIAANDGFAPGSPNSVFKKYGFDVELRLQDDPVQSAETYATGQAHTMWGTLDMIALFAPQLKKVGLTPKVYQQIDWSQGGDGVVVRSQIRNVKGLAGKTIALCQNSPSHYYILRLLADQGLSHRDVSFRFTQTAFGASNMFATDPTVHACVSWAPDIYTLTDPEKNPGGRARLLSTTADAANVIADVYGVRPDFAEAHPEIVRDLVKGIFEGIDKLKENPDRVAQLMAQGFHLPVEDCQGMMMDAYPTGLGDNIRFFTDDSYAANFQSTWDSANKIYSDYGAIQGAVVPASEVMDASVIQQLQSEGSFRDQKAQAREFQPLAIDVSKIEAGEDDILNVPFRIQFKPNKWDLDAEYDDSIPATMKQIKELCQRYAGARIMIEGNVDTSKKNQIRRLGQRQYAVMGEAVLELSEKRAGSVREALLEAMPDEDPNRFMSFGNGWDNPIDLLDHAKNRRVDIRVIRLE